jgi:dihydrodipicolinate synthase/N-acetylneuraminate lyase
VAASLAGLWGFALTPFRDGRIDEDAYAAGVRLMATGGADVIAAAAPWGQGDRMSPDERIDCIRLAVPAAGQLSVVGTLRAGDDPSVAAAALEAGASAVLVLPESGAVADALVALRGIEAATEGRLPVVLYQRGALFLEPDDLRRLADVPALKGLKDAHGDMRRFRRLREALGPRLTWIGASEDLVLAFWAYGADAVSPASLAYAPWYARRVWDLLRAGDREEAVRLLRLFAWPVTDLRLSRPNIDITVAREFAAEFGLEVGEARPPAEPLTDAERMQVRRLLDVLRAAAPAPV